MEKNKNSSKQKRKWPAFVIDKDGKVITNEDKNFNERNKFDTPIMPYSGDKVLEAPIFNKKIKETMETKNIENLNRITGKTTRIIDQIIQELFNNPNQYISVLDHHPGYHAAHNLMTRLKRRLDIEHPASEFKIIFSKGVSKIKLVQEL